MGAAYHGVRPHGVRQGADVWLLLPQGSTSLVTVVLAWSILLDQSEALSRKSRGWPPSRHGGGPGEARLMFEAGFARGAVFGASTDRALAAWGAVALQSLRRG